MSVESDGGIDMEEEKQEQEDVKQGVLQHETVKIEKVVKKTEKSSKNNKKAIMIVLSIIIVWWCMNSIDERFNQLEEGIDTAYNIMGYISNQDVANEVHSVLEGKTFLLASTDWNIKMRDKDTKKVGLTMIVVPKEYVQGMEVDFSADCSDGAKLSVKGEEREEMNFVGKLEVPFSELVNIYVTMKKGDVVQTQQILSDTVEENFVLDVRYDWMGKCVYHGGVVNMNGQVKVDDELDSRYEENLRALKNLDVVLYVANKEWKRLPVETGQDEKSYNGISVSPRMEGDREKFSGISYLANVKETILLEVGEALKMTIEGEDQYGIHYRKVVMQTHIKENGESVNEWGFTEKTEVY